jgi:hypothetical protein
MMKKKVLIFLLMVLMLLFMVACKVEFQLDGYYPLGLESL